MRLLYGGRNSLEIGVIATLITMILATIIGVAAGYFRGWVDGILARILDLLWAYPVVILGVALGVTLAVGGLNLGLFQLKGNSLMVPAVIIGVIYVPYVAKPMRGQVLEPARARVRRRRARARARATCGSWPPRSRPTWSRR